MCRDNLAACAAGKMPLHNQSSPFTKAHLIRVFPASISNFILYYRSSSHRGHRAPRENTTLNSVSLVITVAGIFQGSSLPHSHFSGIETPHPLCGFQA